MCISRLLRIFFRKYLVWELGKGNHQLVYHLAQVWERKDQRVLDKRRWLHPLRTAKSVAACDIQERLIENHGYHRCPACTWATEMQNEHMLKGTYCKVLQQEKGTLTHGAQSQ